MLKFDCDGKSYKTYLKYKKNYIRAICDTGATMSAMDIYTLSKLTGFKPQEIYTLAESWIKRGKQYYGASTASGKLDRTINIILNNVYIDSTYFAKFYTRLNVDSELWRTDGSIELDNKQIILEPIILIGLDIIRACNFTGDKDKIELHNFNYEEYKRDCSKIYIDSLHLYNSKDVMIEKQDLLANYVYDVINKDKL